LVLAERPEADKENEPATQLPASELEPKQVSTVGVEDVPQTNPRREAFSPPVEDMDEERDAPEVVMDEMEVAPKVGEETEVPSAEVVKAP
jgi:hypothetical protein